MAFISCNSRTSGFSFRLPINLNSVGSARVMDWVPNYAEVEWDSFSAVAFLRQVAISFLPPHSSPLKMKTFLHSSFPLCDYRVFFWSSLIFYYIYLKYWRLSSRVMQIAVEFRSRFATNKAIILVDRLLPHGCPTLAKRRGRWDAMSSPTDRC